MKLVVITGPTASGKTALAVKLARALDGEIVSVDSRQVYRGLDIGSGKDLAEYGSGPNRVPTHLLDIADPAADEPYTLADFMRDSKRAVSEIVSRGRVPVLCGGTALYLTALIRGYELPGGPADRRFRSSVKELSPEDLLRLGGESAALAECERANPYRLARRFEIRTHAEQAAPSAGGIPGAEYLVLGAYRPRSEVRRRIETRLDERLRNGMPEEIRNLHEKAGVSWEKLRSFGLEYRELSAVFDSGVPESEARERLLIKIRQFAKRQDTWFRKMEKEGIPIYWLSPEDLDGALKLCQDFLAGKQLPPPAFSLARNERDPG